MHLFHLAVRLWLQTLSAVFLVGLAGSTAVLLFTFAEDVQTMMGRE